MADQEDDGDVSEPWEETARALARAAEPPADDYQRHLDAEHRWQLKLRTRELWEEVKRWIALGR
jgi:hypothetical protein